MNRRIVAGLVAASVTAVAVPGWARAQEAVITGRVVSDRGGQAVVGASVAIPELGVGVITNAVGNYTLTVPAARVRGQSVTVIARYIGFVAQRRTVALTAGRQAQAFTLVTDANRLTEVVVTGVATGTEQVRTPFTVQRIDSSQTPVVGTSAISQLQGKVPGANIVAASGRPGAAPSVLMRGPTSINASGRTQQPLYIVDGILLNGTIADINPNDIESIEVVKGAAAANLYGARAGAGVINITTKSGRNASNRVKFGVRAEGGVGDIPGRFSLAEQNILVQDPTARFYCSTATTNGSPCTQLVDLATETRRVNEVAQADALLPTNLRYDAGIGRAPGYGQLTGQFQTGRWNETRSVQDQIITQNGFSNSNVDVRGQVGNTGVYGSVSNLTNQGAFRFLGGYVRNGVRANIDQRFSDRLSLSLQTFYSATRSSGDNQDAASEGAGNGFFRLTRTPAYVNLGSRTRRGASTSAATCCSRAARTRTRCTTSPTSRTPPRGSASSGAARSSTTRPTGSRSRATSASTAARATTRSSATAASARPRSRRLRTSAPSRRGRTTTSR
jgi:TonB-dependent SusC/RagA subfamily outer membrane receptor